MSENIPHVKQLLEELAARLSGQESAVWLINLERFMRKEPSWLNTPAEGTKRKQATLNELYSVFIQKPMPSFRDLLESGSSALQQCFFNINFTDWFGDIREESKECKQVKCYELSEEMSDRDLIEALGGPARATTPFSIFLGALFEHGDGSPNIFGESDETHVFYISDKNAILRAIAIACKNGVPQHISAHSLRSNARWNKMRRVFATA